MDLSAFRKRRSLTQLDVARRLGVAQSTVSRMEKGDNMFVSSLVRYLDAMGAERTRLVATIDGAEVELDLSGSGDNPRTGSHSAPPVQLRRPA